MSFPNYAGLIALIAADVAVSGLTVAAFEGKLGMLTVFMFPGLVVVLLGQGTGMSMVTGRFIAVIVNVIFYTLLILLAVNLKRRTLAGRPNGGKA